MRDRDKETDGLGKGRREVSGKKPLRNGYEETIAIYGVLCIAPAPAHFPPVVPPIPFSYVPFPRFSLMMKLDINENSFFIIVIIVFKRYNAIAVFRQIP